MFLGQSSIIACLQECCFFLPPITVSVSPLLTSLFHLLLLNCVRVCVLYPPIPSFLSICLSFLPCCFLSYLSGSFPCPAFVLSIHLLVSCPTPQAVSCPIHPQLFTCVWSILPLYLSCPLSYLSTCLVLPFCDMSYLSTCLVVPFYLLCPIFLPILSYLSM